MPKEREKTSEIRRIREADNAVRNLHSFAPHHCEVDDHSNVSEALPSNWNVENFAGGAFVHGVSDVSDDFGEIVKPFDCEDYFLDGQEDGLVDFSYEDNA